MKSPKEQVKLTQAKGLMIEAHGTAFFRGLIEEGERLKMSSQVFIGWRPGELVT